LAPARVYDRWTCDSYPRVVANETTLIRRPFSGNGFIFKFQNLIRHARRRARAPTPWLRGRGIRTVGQIRAANWRTSRSGRTGTGVGAAAKTGGSFVFLLRSRRVYFLFVFVFSFARCAQDGSAVELTFQFALNLTVDDDGKVVSVYRESPKCVTY